MKPFRVVWEVHKWIGIGVGAILVLSAVTGLFLLLKKEFAWIQPPTQRGVAADASDLRPIQEVYQAVFDLGLPEFRSEADIDRIDFRPDKRIHKVRSVHGNLEVQVDATTLETWGPDERRSDWLETLHDGSWFGDWAHDWVFPLVAILLVALTITGYLIWLWPKVKRSRKRRAAAAKP